MTRAQRREALAKKLGISASGKSLKELEKLVQAKSGASRPKAGTSKVRSRSAQRRQELFAGIPGKGNIIAHGRRFESMDQLDAFEKKVGAKIKAAAAAGSGFVVKKFGDIKSDHKDDGEVVGSVSKGRRTVNIEKVILWDEGGNAVGFAVVEGNKKVGDVYWDMRHWSGFDHAVASAKKHLG